VILLVSEVPTHKAVRTSVAIEKECTVMAIDGKIDEAAAIDFPGKNGLVCPLAFIKHEIVETVLAPFDPDAIAAILIEIRREKKVAVL
jgi:hypothetical protein